MLERLIDRIAAAVPGQCAVCRAWPAEPVCAGCIARFAPVRPRCRRCALTVPAGVAECGRCLGTPPPLDDCHAVVSYEFPWTALIAHYKFEGQAAWGRSFARLMRRSPQVAAALAQADLVLPMPLSRQRLAGRGFNQALLLARALDRKKTRASLLLRIRHTAAQAALAREDRLGNVEGAFAVEPRMAAQLRAKRLVLVDDVMTSGASLFSAALALRQAGAQRVTGLVFARTD